MQHIVCIVGPTASGKTDLAVAIAEQYGGEVISADSRQIYRGCDVGTEKIDAREMRGIPHHCIDIASPRRAFSVAAWKRHAERALASIVRRGRLPIVAGGTGMYFDALIFDRQYPQVPPNPALRRTLAALSTQELFAMLQELDPMRARTVEEKNPRRLIRAIEIAQVLGNVPPVAASRAQYDAVWIGLYPGMGVIEERIEARLDATLGRGLIDETRSLRDMGISWRRIDELGLEYRICAAFIRGEITESELRDRMILKLRQYAKRQMTWFRRNTAIHWFANAREALRNLSTTDGRITCSRPEDPLRVHGTRSRRP